jgi:hypothetical protein
MNMDKEIAQYLWGLRKINEALIGAMNTAIFVLENYENLPKERMQSLIDSLKQLVTQSEEAYGTEPPAQ